MPKLIVKHPEKGETSYPLQGDRITVGRRADNQIQINHGTISGHHAEIVKVNGMYHLRDLDSTNHCFVDGFQVTEADLSERCTVVIGTVECEYVPGEPAPVQAAAPASGEFDNLRKTVGLLREQNEELIKKNNDQQKQIEILGSARLLTPGSSGDLTALKVQVTALSEERDKLLKENQTLKGEVERLRNIAARSGETSSLKATVPIALPADGTVSVGPGGTTSLAAPMARVVAPPPDPVVEVAPQLVEFSAAAKLIVADLAKNPASSDTRGQLAEVAERLAERSAVISTHPVARLLSGFESLARDIVQRNAEVDPSVVKTLSDAVQVLERVLAPETLKRAKTLPVPQILALSEDEYLLPGIVAALEFAHFQIESCTTGDKALARLKDRSFDLLLMGAPLPGSTVEDVRAPMRSLPKGDRLPVIALTPENMPKPAGANDAMAQPLNLFELTLKSNVWVLRNQLDLL